MMSALLLMQIILAAFDPETARGSAALPQPSLPIPTTPQQLSSSPNVATVAGALAPIMIDALGGNIGNAGLVRSITAPTSTVPDTVPGTATRNVTAGGALTCLLFSIALVKVAADNPTWPNVSAAVAVFLTTLGCGTFAALQQQTIATARALYTASTEIRQTIADIAPFGGTTTNNIV